MSEDELLSALKESESLKESEKNFENTKRKINFSTTKIKKIKKSKKVSLFLSQKSIMIMMILHIKE